ncbi:MAG: EamA family transporter [Candidatus Nealsonbacteria bacterium]|nr:EamA family transporter [Candidatus Nealsonbacteria bacterium]
MGIILGIASGFFHALMSVASKKALEGTNQYLLGFAYAAFSLPFLLLALFWLDLAPTNFSFWWATIASSASSIIALILFMKALQIGELSLTAPLLSFTPVFLIFTSRIMLGESIGFLGICGVALITAGTYALELRREKGIWGPIKALLKDKAALMTLIVALIYSVSSNFNKIAVANSSPITYLVFVQMISALVFITIIFLKSDQKFAGIKSGWKMLLAVGLFTALSLFAQMTALTLAMVPYVISLKRTSAVFSVILGFIAFKERNIKPKLIGSILMMAGVLLISIS